MSANVPRHSDRTTPKVRAVRENAARVECRGEPGASVARQGLPAISGRGARRERAGESESYIRTGDVMLSVRPV